MVLAQIERRGSRLLVVLSVVLMMFLSGCATRIPLSSLVPAQHDMSSYQILLLHTIEPYRFSLSDEPARRVEDFSARAPVQVYSGYQPFSGRSVASTVFATLENQLADSPFITVTQNWERTVGVGARAQLSVQISNIDITEYIYAKGDEDSLAFNLHQQVQLTLVYQVSDIDTHTVIHRGTVHTSEEQTYTLDTDSSQVIFAPSLGPVLEGLAKEAAQALAYRLVPRERILHVALLKSGRGSHELFDEAYDDAKENPQEAFNRFNRLFREYGDARAGYNAAILAEAMGSREKAYALMEKVVNTGEVSRAQRQWERMQRTLEQHLEAQEQIQGRGE